MSRRLFYMLLQYCTMKYNITRHCVYFMSHYIIRVLLCGSRTDHLTPFSVNPSQRLKLYLCLIQGETPVPDTASVVQIFFKPMDEEESEENNNEPFKIERLVYIFEICVLACPFCCIFYFSFPFKSVFVSYTSSPFGLKWRSLNWGDVNKYLKYIP